MSDLYDTVSLYATVRFYMSQGMSFEEALEEIQSLLHTQFDENILTRVREEHNFNLYHRRQNNV